MSSPAAAAPSTVPAVGLAVRVRFHGGVYYAACPVGGLETPEWPPHPGRLFAALTAAHHAQGASEQTAAALDWLEAQGEQGAPAVHATSRATPREHGVTVFVRPTDVHLPVTDQKVEQVRTRLDAAKAIEGKPRAQPATVLGGEPDVWFLWAAAPPPAVVDALARLCGDVPYLGTTDSPVVVTVEDPAVAPPATHLPAVGGRLVCELRVPYPGLRDRLNQAYGTGRRGDGPTRLRPTGIIGYRHARPSRFDAAGMKDMLVMYRRAGQAVPIEAADRVARSYRVALLGALGDDAPAVLHGHDDAAGHCGIYALPWVGEPHADGTLLAVAVAFPAPHVRDVSDADRALVRVAARAVTRLNLGSGAGIWRLADTTNAPAAARRYLDPARWAGPACRWRTVTPVTFDRHPKGGGLLPAVAKMCAHAGLPAPSVARLLAGSPLAGVPGDRRFPQDKRGGLRGHLEVEFDRPVGGGPVALGRGRFLGLGLMVPMPDDPNGASR